MDRFCFTSFSPNSLSTLEDRYAAGTRGVHDRAGRQIRIRSLSRLQYGFRRPADQKIPAALQTGGIDDDRVIDVKRWPAAAGSPPSSAMVVFLQAIIVWISVNGFGATGSALQPERSDSSAVVIFGLPLPAVRA
jgi:hypothetical protein